MTNLCLSSALRSASLLLALLGSTRGGNLAETVEFREFIYDGLRNVRWEGNKEVSSALNVVERLKFHAALSPAGRIFSQD